MPYGNNTFGRYGGEGRPGLVSSFASGFGAGESIQDSIMRRRVAQEALQRKGLEREAMKQFSLSGDIKDIYPVMEPEKAAMLSLQLPAEQADAMNKALDWFRNVGTGATLADYPALREDFFRQFPQVSKSAVPPVERFGGSEEALRRYLEIPRLLALQGKILPAQIAAEASKYKTDVSAEATRYGADTRAAATRYKADVGAEKKGAGMFGDFSKQYQANHPEASFDQIWQAYKSGAAGTKAYSPEEQDKLLAEKVIQNIYAGPSKLRKEYEKADSAGKSAILGREKELLRPQMFPAPKMAPRRPAEAGTAKPDLKNMSTAEIKAMIEQLRGGR